MTTFGGLQPRSCCGYILEFAALHATFCRSGSRRSGRVLLRSSAFKERMIWELNYRMHTEHKKSGFVLLRQVKCDVTSYHASLSKSSLDEVARPPHSHWHSGWAPLDGRAMMMSRDALRLCCSALTHWTSNMLCTAEPRQKNDSRSERCAHVIDASSSRYIQDIISLSWPDPTTVTSTLCTWRFQCQNGCEGRVQRSDTPQAGWVQEEVVNFSPGTAEGIRVCLCVNCRCVAVRVCARARAR